jgi:hypothetical protein
MSNIQQIQYSRVAGAFGLAAGLLLLLIAAAMLIQW